MLRTNPGGGGASESTEAPRYRTWFEGYGISANNGPLGLFVGDRRKTWGGVAGIGARIAPGINIGFSVDQSRTDIDVPLALQSATIDLTQFGFNASVDAGPWTWASAIVHGFGNINSRRDTGLGFATAGYNARLDGAISEISYYWSKDQYRIVPKGAFEYVRARTGSLQEFGGLDPVMATGATVERSACWSAPRSGVTGSSTRRFSTSRPTASSSTTSCRISPTSPSASAARASLPGHRRKPVRRGRRRFGLAEPEQHRARSTSTTTPNSAPPRSRTRARWASS